MITKTHALLGLRFVAGGLCGYSPASNCAWTRMALTSHAAAGYKVRPDKLTIPMSLKNFG